MYSDPFQKMHLLQMKEKNHAFHSKCVRLNLGLVSSPPLFFPPSLFSPSNPQAYPVLSRASISPLILIITLNIPPQANTSILYPGHQ